MSIEQVNELSHTAQRPTQVVQQQHEYERSMKAKLSPIPILANELAHRCLAIRRTDLLMTWQLDVHVLGLEQNP